MIRVAKYGTTSKKVKQKRVRYNLILFLLSILKVKLYIHNK